MRSEQWQVIEELYHSASDLPEPQRSSFLQRACGEDQDLLLELESLLRHGDTPRSFLDTAAIAIVAKAIAADEYDPPAPALEPPAVRDGAGWTPPRPLVVSAPNTGTSRRK